MKKEKIINIILALAVVVLLGIFAFSVRVRPLADKVVVLRTAGMTEGHVAGIEKALQLKKGVAAVEVDVDAGRVTAAYNSTAVKPEILAETLTALGYGSSILQTQSAEQYRATTGGSVAARTAKAGGCGGGCCKRN